MSSNLVSSGDSYARMALLKTQIADQQRVLVALMHAKTFVQMPVEQQKLQMLKAEVKAMVVRMRSQKSHA